MLRKLCVLLVLSAGCGNCEDESFPDDPDISWSDMGDDSSNSTHTDLDLDMTDIEDTGEDADLEDLAKGPDTGDDVGTDVESDFADDMASAPVCGNGIIEPFESCDDGNVDDGDYCSASCGDVTGRCGDGVVQDNETCDDGQTQSCLNTNDGGDGRCVAMGTCSPGYSMTEGMCKPTNTTGLTEPCQNGPGYTLLRFSFSNNSTSASVDVWDASCSYSFANQACNVQVVYPGFGSVSRTSEGYPILTSTHYLRARFSVAGLSFTQATLWVQARSYSTGSSTQTRAWSPLYGDVFGGPVDNDFTYDWYALDWSQHLFPTDNPNLTAFQIYAHQGSGSLATRAVELCVE